MGFFTTTPAGFDDDLREFDCVKEYRVRVDVDSTPVDLTSYLDNNDVEISHRDGNGAQASVGFRNSAGTFSEGEYAKATIGIDARVNSSDWIEVFYGWIDDKGAKLDIGAGKSARAQLQAHTIEKRFGTRQKPANTVLSGWTVCDTAAPSTSIVHKLAELMGLASGDLDVGDIEHSVDWVHLGKRSPWQELRDLADLYRGTLYTTAAGKLRLRSLLFETTPPSLTPEWSFANDDASFAPNIRDLKSPAQGEYLPISCNRASCEFDDYESLGVGRVIWKSVEGYDEVTTRINIVLDPGECWPVLDNASAPAKLSYVDPATGEEIPYAVDVITPTAGYYGSGSDIESVNGVVTVLSFNGSTAATESSPDHSEIILRNDTGSQIVIYKFQVRGTGYRVKANEKVVSQDVAITDEEDFVDDTLPGTYAATRDQVHYALQDLVHRGKGGRRRWSFTTHWLPQVQIDALVQFRKPGDSYVTCRVAGYSHPAPNGPMTKAETRLEIEEYDAFSPSGTATPAVLVTGTAAPAPSEEEFDAAIAERPTYTDISDGYDDAGGTGGTTTPTVPTPFAFSAELGVALGCDRQSNLTNFARYEWQVSDDAGTTAYALAFDGTGLGVEDADFDTQTEFFLHRPLPLDESGGADDPAAKDWHYRTRRVTKLGVASAWSDWTSAQSLPIGAGALAAESVYAANIGAANFQALFATVSVLIAGLTGTGSIASPAEGDMALRIQNAMMTLVQFLNGGWSDVNKLSFGLMVGSSLLAMVGCHGIVNPEADVTDIPTEPIPNERFHLLTFEDDYADQYGIEPDAETNVERSSTWAKFGTYSLGATSGHGGNLQYNDVFSLTENIGACSWIRCTAVAGSIYIHYATWYVDASNYLACATAYNPTSERLLAVLTELVGGSSVQSVEVELSVSTSEWTTGEHHVGIVLSYDDGKLYLTYDGRIASAAISAITLSGAATINLFEIDVFNTTNVTYQDDVLFAYDDACNPDLFVRHYLSGLAWSTERNYNDLPLIPGPSGVVRVMGDHRIEGHAGFKRLTKSSDYIWLATDPGLLVVDPTDDDVDITLPAPADVRDKLLRVDVRHQSYGMISNGDCESATPPQLTDGGTLPSPINCTWERSSEEAFKGTYSYKMTVTTGGSAAYIYFASTASGLKGFTVGKRHTFSCWIKIPSTGGPAPSEVGVYLRDYDGAWDLSIHRTTESGVWQRVMFHFSPQAAATAISGNIVIDATAGSGEYIRVAEIQCWEDHQVNLIGPVSMGGSVGGLGLPFTKPVLSSEGRSITLRSNGQFFEVEDDVAGDMYWNRFCSNPQINPNAYDLSSVSTITSTLWSIPDFVPPEARALEVDVFMYRSYAGNSLVHATNGYIWPAGYGDVPDQHYLQTHGLLVWGSYESGDAGAPATAEARAGQVHTKLPIDATRQFYYKVNATSAQHLLLYMSVRGWYV